MEHYYYRKTHFAVTRLDFNTYVLTERTNNNGILVMSFNTFGEVDINAEIEGKSSLLYRAVRLSHDNKQTIFTGIIADYGDEKRLSVFVAHKGELIDIVDSTQVSEEENYALSGQIKIFNVSGLRIAVLVDADAVAAKPWNAVTGKADMVLSIGLQTDAGLIKEAEKKSDRCGIPLLYCGKDESLLHIPKR